MDQITKCVKPGCQFDETGICAEGLDPKECPNILKTQVSPAVSEPASTEIDLRSGEELDIGGVTLILKKALARAIVIAGDVNNGKTTLVAAIYDKFNLGPYAGLLFGGSETLAGLERRCHLARVTSGAIKADTERTPVGNMGYLHLRLRTQDLRDPAQDIIFSDLSGETFRMARDSTDECKKLRILSRCDHFVLLLDGERLNSNAQRQAVFHSGASLLRSCADAGMLGKQSIVHVVVSKGDLVVNNDIPTQDFLSFIENQFHARFASRFGKFYWRKIAARPADEDILPFGHGLDSLLSCWFNETLLLTREPEPYSQVVGLRSFESFTEV